MKMDMAGAGPHKPVLHSVTGGRVWVVAQKLSAFLGAYGPCIKKMKLTENVAEVQ